MTVIKEIEDNRPFSTQIILGLITSFVSIAPSMTLGFSAVALPVLTDFTDEQLSWFASVTLLAMPFGCFIVGPLTDKYGRLPMMNLINLISIIGWASLFIAHYCGDAKYGILLVGRTITGLTAGLTATPSCIYMAEVVSKKYRGVFATWNSIFFALGITTVYVLGYIFGDQWHFVCLTTAILALISLICTFTFVPESPVWLISHNRIEEATKSMSRLYRSKTTTPIIQQEIDHIIKTKQNSTDSCNPTNKSVLGKIMDDLSEFMTPNVYKPFFIMTFYFIFQQLSGLQTVVFYAIDIVKGSGIEFNEYLAIVLIALTRTILTALVSILLKYVGVRALSITSGLGSGASIVLLAVYLQLIDNGTVTNQSSLAFIPISLLLLFIFFGTLGYLTLPYVMSAEVFPVKVRCTAAGLTSAFSNVLNFFMVKFYINMVDAMHESGVFYFYGAFAFIGAVFFVIWLPETRNMTLEEIQERYFVKTKRLGVV